MRGTGRNSQAETLLQARARERSDISCESCRLPSPVPRPPKALLPSQKDVSHEWMNRKFVTCSISSTLPFPARSRAMERNLDAIGEASVMISSEIPTIPRDASVCERRHCWCLSRARAVMPWGICMECPDTPAPLSARPNCSRRDAEGSARQGKYRSSFRLSLDARRWMVGTSARADGGARLDRPSPSEHSALWVWRRVPARQKLEDELALSLREC